MTGGRLLVAAAALLAGAGLAGADRARAVVAGVAAGCSAQALEILVRAAAGTAPDAWFKGRMLEGPVGYHNAQGLLAAVSLPLALSLAATARTPAARAAAALMAAPLLGLLLLTQSRGALVAVALAVMLQTALSRHGRLAALAVLLAAGGGALAVALRSVDRALVEGGPAASVAELRTYALVTAGVAAVLAAAAALPVPQRLRPPRRVLVLVAAVALAVSAGVGAHAAAPHLRSLAAGAITDTPPDAAPGATRFASISLDGRRDAWRVAAGMIAGAPLTGDGVGSFAVRWGTDRRLADLYVLQPHSLELELGAELGIPAIAVFVAFLLAAALALRRAVAADRAIAAAAAAALAALVIEVSVDWTWSFPGIVAPVLLVVGAAAAAREPRRGPARWWVVLPLAAAALLALAVPYAAASRLAAGQVGASLRLDPWNAAAVSAQGRLLEEQGRFVAAAARYARAATLSQRPWLESFRQARALRRAGDIPGTVAACMRAQHADPPEDALHVPPCGWPWLALHVPGTRPPGPEGGPTRLRSAGA